MSTLTFLRRSPLLAKTVIALAYLHVLVQLFVWLPIHWARTDTTRVMVLYHKAGYDIDHHRSPYSDPSGFGPDREPQAYYYPPLFAATMAPLARLSWLTFSRLWYVLMLVFFWTFCWSLARIVQGKPTLLGVLLTGAAVGYTPGAYAAMSIGQIDPLLWACAGLALGSKSGRTRDCLLAAIAQIKLYAIWPLLYSFSRTRGATVLPALAVVLAGTAIGVCVCGPSSYAAWWAATSPVISQGTFVWSNFSLSFAGLRLARWAGWPYAGGPLPAWARLYLGVLEVVGPAAASIFALRAGYDLPKACAVILVAAVLLSPLCWWSYLPLAYIAIALFVRDALAQRNASQEVAFSS